MGGQAPAASRDTGRRSSLIGAAFAILVAAALCLGCGAQASTGADVLVPGFNGELSAWSPNSEVIATPRTKRIQLRGLGGQTHVIRGPGLGHFGWPCECRLGWSADGGRILFVSRRGGIEGAAIVGSIGIDGRDARSASLGVPVGAATWSRGGWPLVFVPSARSVKVGGGRLGPVPDLWRLDRLHGKPHRLLAQAGEENDPLVSPDGTKILYTRGAGRRSGLWEVGIDGSKPHRLMSGARAPAASSWSPGGAEIALAMFSNRDHRCHLYVLPAEGGMPRQLVAEEILPNRPAWSPDGNSIAFSNYDGEIRQVRIDDGTVSAIASLPGKEVTGLEWSPDGQHLGYSARDFPVGD